MGYSSSPPPYVPLTLLNATSATKTPAASGQYMSMSSSSIALTVGTWLVHASCDFGNSGTPLYTACVFGIYGANGADSATVPTLLSATSNLTVNSVFNAAQSRIEASANEQIIMSPTMIVTVTATVTIYPVPFAAITTAANARVITYITGQKIY